MLFLVQLIQYLTSYGILNILYLCRTQSVEAAGAHVNLLFKHIYSVTYFWSGKHSYPNTILQRIVISIFTLFVSIYYSSWCLPFTVLFWYCTTCFLLKYRCWSSLYCFHTFLHSVSKWWLIHIFNSQTNLKNPPPSDSNITVGSLTLESVEMVIIWNLPLCSGFRKRCHIRSRWIVK